MERRQWNLAAILATGVALASLSPVAHGQNDTSRNTQVPPTGIRAKTKEEMNLGKHYLGMNHPSTLPDAAQLTQDALQFMRMAAMDGMTEVKLGQLALDKSKSDAVREFAQRMIKDHTKANNQLAHLAQDKGLSLPVDMDAKHQAVFDRLSNLSGAAFDSAYARTMVADHERAVHDFTARANNGRNTDLRSWTATTVPALRKHLDMARDLNNQINGRSAGIR